MFCNPLFKTLPLLIMLVSQQNLAQAANVWHVGKNQPGKLAEISTAVARAGQNDIIWVDPGIYEPFTVSAKSLSILATGDHYNVKQKINQAAITVSTLVPQQSVSIFDAEITFEHKGVPAIKVDLVLAGAAVRFKNTHIKIEKDMPDAVNAVIDIKNADTVWFAELVARANGHGNAATAAGHPIAGNDAISIIRAEKSNLILQTSHIKGFDNAPSKASGQYSGDGVRLVDSHLVLYGPPSIWETGTYLGGSQGKFGGHAFHRVESTPEASPTFACGASDYQGSWGSQREGLAVAINNWGRQTQGTSIYDPLLVFCLGPAFSGIKLQNDRFKKGSSVDGKVWSIYQSSPWVLFQGLARHYATYTGGSSEGRIMLNMNLPIIYMADSSNHTRRISWPIDNHSAFVGLQGTVQAVLGPPSAAPAPAYNFSIPSMYVITD